MPKEIYLNGKDFTKMFTPCGYSVSYQPVYGKNGGMMLDGSTVDDEIAIKAVLTLPVMPLSEQDLTELLNEIYTKVYVTVTYFDIKENKNREAVFRRGSYAQKYLGYGSDQKEYWSGRAITLTEK